MQTACTLFQSNSNGKSLLVLYKPTGKNILLNLVNPRDTSWISLGVIIEYCSILFMYLDSLDQRDRPRFTNDEGIPSLPWRCSFGEDVAVPDWCDMKQDEIDHHDWVAWIGLSDAAHTGPPESTILRHGKILT